MAIDEVLINVALGETRIALVESGILRELLVERPDQESVVGNVYLGRVERVLPGIEAAFVDIGLTRAGFLALADARTASEATGGTDARIADYVGEGDAVLVQVLSDAFDDKGAKLTTRVTLPGRYLVYAADGAKVRVSRRITGDDERARLATLLDELAEDGEGFIVRTAASGAGHEELARDVANLRAAWLAIADNRSTTKPPALLHGELDPVCRILRDESGGALTRIVVDDSKTLARVRKICQRFSPALGDRLVLHDASQTLFEMHGIEEQIEGALSPLVELPSGGRIFIDETAALTAIDVNTGGGTQMGGQQATALRTNLEAAAEIGHQIRLRNLSGLLVVDFVPMRRHQHGAEMLVALRAAVAEDPCSTHVFGFTRLGLVEMTRRRRRGSLSQTLTKSCPPCAGSGRVNSPLTVALEALRAALREAGVNPGAVLQLTAHPNVIGALDGPAATALADTEARLGRPLVLNRDGAFPPGRFEVACTQGRGRDGDG